MPYFVYILRCQGGSLYTGSTNDVTKRFAAHKKGLGARYTRSHPPKAIVYTQKLRTKGAALSREAKIKQLSRTAKLKLLTEK